MNKCLKCKASHAPPPTPLPPATLCQAGVNFSKHCAYAAFAADIRRIQFVCLPALMLSSCCCQSRQHITKQATSLDCSQCNPPPPSLPLPRFQRPHLTHTTLINLVSYFDNLKLCLPRWKILRLFLSLSASSFFAVIFIICHTSSSLA